MVKTLKKALTSANRIRMLTALLAVSFTLLTLTGSTLTFLVTRTPTLNNLFTSGLVRTGTLAVHKIVEHPFGDGYAVPDNDHTRFSFRVELGAEHAQETFGDYTADENGVIMLLVKAGETVSIPGIPAREEVTVTEQEPGSGFSVLDGEDTRTASIRADEVTTLNFTNVYAPEKALSDVTVSGSKMLEGREWQEGDSFTFLLERYGEGEWTVLGEQSITCRFTEEGTPDPDSLVFDFGDVMKQVDFDEAGTYSFRVREEEGSIGGITYDKAESLFDVLVGDADMDGSLEIQSITSASQNTQVEGHDVKIAFVNRYAPVGSTEATIRIRKNLEDRSGQNLTPEGFTFELYNEANELVAVSDATSAAGETQIRLVFTPEDAGKTYAYTLKESGGGTTANGMQYDSSEIPLYISVVDNLDGTVSAYIYGEDGLAQVFETILEAEPGEESAPSVEEEVPGDEVSSAEEESKSDETSSDAEESESDETSGSAEEPKDESALTGEEAQSEETPSDTEGSENEVVSADEEEAKNAETSSDAEELEEADSDSVEAQSADISLAAKEPNEENASGGAEEAQSANASSSSEGPREENASSGTEEAQSEKSLTGAEGTDSRQTSNVKEEVALTSPDITLTAAPAPILTEGEKDPEESKSVATAQKIPDGVTNIYEAEFTNIYDPADAEVLLGGTKELSGRDLKAGEFRFDLYETGADFTVPEGAQPTLTAVNRADGGFSFDPLSFGSVGTWYYVAQEDTSSLPGGVTGDNAKYFVTIQVSDEKGVLSAKTLIADGSGESGEIQFRNQYQAEETAVRLSGSKRLEGRELKDQEFLFELYAADETFARSGTPLQAVHNAADGSFDFDALTYSQAGVWYYVVKENGTAAAPGIVYDGAQYQVTVVVTDDGEGQLIPAVSMTRKDGQEQSSADQIEFVNRYSSKYASLSLKGEKILHGATLREGMFTFLLTGADEHFTPQGETLQRAVNHADGSFAFDALTWETTGTWYYVITEDTLGALDGITYDDTVYGVTVTVTDDGDGQLLASASIVETDKGAAKKVVFENTYEAADTDDTVRIRVKKTVENTGSESIGPEGFTFVLENTDTGEKSRVESDEDGRADFRLIFTKSDVGQTYYYRLYEKDDGRDGVTYSDKEYRLKIRVLEDESGQVTAKLYSGESEKDSFTAEFVNQYRSEDEIKAVSPGDEGADESRPTGGTRTGDEGDPLLWIALIFLSVVGLVWLGRKVWKKKEV